MTALTRDQDHKRKGFNLIEVALVLGVVGIVVGGIWAAAAAVQENARISRTKAGIFQVVARTQNLISSSQAEIISGGAWVSILPALIAGGALPADWVVNSTTAQSPYGTTVQITTAANRFDFSLFNIPQSSCIRLLTEVSATAALAGSAGSGSSTRPSLGYVSTHNGDGSVYVSSTTTFPINLTTAQTMCVNSLSKVVFTFGYSR